MALIFFFTLWSFMAVCSPLQEEAKRAASQNPSPMTDSTRSHVRIPQKPYAGISFTISDLFSQPVDVFIPRKVQHKARVNLLIHFHGANFVLQHAVSETSGDFMAAVINLGAGSKVYADAFDSPERFLLLLECIRAETGRRLGHGVAIEKVTLSGFSAGYGAIRRILQWQADYERVASVILLDGLHAGYVPDGRVLYEGGRIDASGLAPFIKLAGESSMKSSAKRFLITHSEIFPGTFVSTTEATDFILKELSVKRHPVLRCGPGGMQQLSFARKSHFEVMGFAGNTAPDHVDHFHGLAYFLKELRKL